MNSENEQKRFSSLNPVFDGKELIMNCPLCANRFSIRVNYQGDPIGPATWGLRHPENVFEWDLVTITPSIANHPRPKKAPSCDAHFSIINGRIL